MKRNYLWLLSLVISFPSLYAGDMEPGYYDRANGFKDAELKDSLKSIIRYHDSIPYGSGIGKTWEVFYYSDQNEDGYCMDMYVYSENWKKFTSPGVAVAGCNIEHSFAKSWWGGDKNAAYMDCYHLNPSNGTANSSRGNYPLGVPVKDFKDQATTGSLKVGMMHHPTMDIDFWVFEPLDEYKGDFARAYFYMATCYGHWSDGRKEFVLKRYDGWRLNSDDVGSKFAMQNDNYLEFQPWEQELLIAWHRQDPVSVKEINRQDAVHNFQHNRNPFIDYPYLAEYIWGEKAGEELNLDDLMASSDPDFIPGESNGWRGGAPVVPKPKFGVNWFVNGVKMQVDSVIENKKVQALPEEPTSCSSESNIFMGWTDTPIEGTSNEKPAILYTDPKDIPAITEDIALYAVFAHAETTDLGLVAKEVTFTFTETISTVTKDDVTITFSQGSGSNAPKYYDSGNAIRCYAKNTITVSAAGLTSIELSFGSGDGSNPITTNVPTFETDTWTGSADEVVFTIGGSSGHRKISGMKVTLNGQSAVTTYDRYITSCQTTEEFENVVSDAPARKILIGGQMCIQVGEALYDITGQRIR